MTDPLVEFVLEEPAERVEEFIRALEAGSVTLTTRRSITMPRYSSRAMGSPCSMSRRDTLRPSGPVWCVTSVMP